jgi:hypothetical protein
MAIVRGMMGYVSQEAVLFPGTIRYNLTVSIPFWDYRLLTWKTEMGLLHHSSERRTLTMYLKKTSNTHAVRPGQCDLLRRRNSSEIPIKRY